MFPPAHSLTLSPSTYIALNGKTSTSETQGWAILKRPRPGVSRISFPNLAPSGACPDSNHCCKSMVHCSQAAQPLFPSTNTARGAARKSSQSSLPRSSNSANESPITIEIEIKQRNLRLSSSLRHKVRQPLLLGRYVVLLKEIFLRPYC